MNGDAHALYTFAMACFWLALYWHRKKEMKLAILQSD
jgi:hypothetical protein